MIDNNTESGFEKFFTKHKRLMLIILIFVTILLIIALLLVLDNNLIDENNQEEYSYINLEEYTCIFEGIELNQIISWDDKCVLGKRVVLGQKSVYEYLKDINASCVNGDLVSPDGKTIAFIMADGHSGIAPRTTSYVFPPLVYHGKLLNPEGLVIQDLINDEYNVCLNENDGCNEFIDEEKKDYYFIYFSDEEWCGPPIP